MILSSRPLRGVLFALLMLAGCAYGIAGGEHVNLQRAQRVYNDIEELRQLNFKTEVPIVRMDPARARFAMAVEMARRYVPPALRRTAQAGVLTGLYGPGVDPGTLALAASSGGAAGFFDPASGQIAVAQLPELPGLWSRIKGLFGAGGGESINQPLLTHELARALEEQYFGVSRRLDQIADNDDRALALQAVAEGDAMLATYGYTRGIVDAETVRELLAHPGDMPEIFDTSTATPATLGDLFRFARADGTRFVAETYLRGGWSAVNELYARPPVSTRQIIEPALYFDHAPPPVRITLRGWARALAGWREVGEDTYGEMLLRVILTRNAHGQAEEGLWRAWRGDRMAVLERGGAIMVVWIVAMSDDTAAAAFARAYEAILARGAADRPVAAHHVERSGAAVLAIIGPGAARSAELAPAVWRGSAIRYGAGG